MTLTDSDPMPFGKYKNKLMEEVPDRYLDWLLGELDKTKASRKLNQNQKAVYEYIMDNLHIIQAGL